MEFKKYQLYPRVINDLKQRSTISIVFFLTTACLVLVTDNYNLRHPEFSNPFLISLSGICLLRLLHMTLAQRTQPKFERFNNLIFILGVAVTAMIWGIGFAKFMIQDGELSATLLMTMCTIGLCAGGAVAFIPDLRLSISFSFFMLVPTIGTMVFYHKNMPLVISLLIFFVYLCFITHRGNREYWYALENEYLLKEKSKEFENMSRIDGLTGLYNRRYFDDALSFEWSRSLRQQTSISIIIFDIDDFKQINDQYGHLAGDQYLKATATIIKNIFKRETDINARYGGDEFIALIANKPLENVLMMAEKVRSMIAALHLEYEGQPLQATISAGAAICVPDKRDKPQSLILKADKALYQSKASGRNKVIGDT
ncbi:MAG: GGDEF domain-containing protein [Deltaproteobacteria bacterium]|uniref:GGDEF domain-containing protein n=1 Tax=Desulfobacula sp. TaxID=2593537 RepID=UPI0019ABCBE9|nr:GGDEF domain-containing protein [Candidatus Desulfobacula maris]MBL6993170.1 GGDEF domain-containing protein [Desulfobacula sp.]